MENSSSSHRLPRLRVDADIVKLADLAKSGGPSGRVHVRADAPVTQDIEQFLLRVRCGWIIPQIVGFSRIGAQIEQLSVGPIDEMHEFPFVSAHHGLVIDDAQSAGGDGRSHDVAAESLEATSVGGFDTGGGMQRESPRGVPQGAGADTVFGITQPTADSTVRSTWLWQQAEA